MRYLIYFNSDVCFGKFKMGSLNVSSTLGNVSAWMRRFSVDEPGTSTISG